MRIDSFLKFIDLFPGNFVLLACGRRFHRIEPVIGKTSRITLSGFLPLDKNRERIVVK